MYYPNIRLEKKLNKQGFKYVAGVDEAGRGSWAGPIIAAGVILDPKVKIKGIKDSKILRKPDREELFGQITESAIAWAIGAIPETEIDQIGIQKANILAMQEALKKLSRQPDYLLVDAFNLNYQQLPIFAIIKGDYKIKSIAAASIIAKVVRDKIMDELDEVYPQYGFKHHKGYGTNHHFQMINEFGICDIHRKSFSPIKNFIN